MERAAAGYFVGERVRRWKSERQKNKNGRERTNYWNTLTNVLSCPPYTHTHRHTHAYEVHPVILCRGKCFVPQDGGDLKTFMSLISRR